MSPAPSPAPTTEPSTNPEPHDELVELAYRLRLACQQISRRVRYESTSELAPHQFSVLARIGGEARTPRELADIERVSPPAMTKTINCLVEAGLASRQPHPADGRQLLITRTAAGEKAFRRIAQERDTWMMRHLLELDEPDVDALRALTPLLERVAAR